MNKFLKRLFVAFKLLALMMLFVGGVIGIWVGFAWGLGCLIDHSFDMAHFGFHSYIAFGSFLLVLIILINVVALILTGWALITYGKARGLIKLSQRPAKE